MLEKSAAYVQVIVTICSYVLIDDLWQSCTFTLISFKQVQSPQAVQREDNLLDLISFKL